MDTKRLSPVSVLAAAVVLTGGLILAGCATDTRAAPHYGKTSTTTSPYDTTVTTVPVTTTTADPDALTNIGTITDVQNGGTIAQSFSLGTARTGTEPSAASGAASACPLTGNSLDTAAYIPASETITYSGAIQEAITVAAPIVSSNDATTQFAVRVNGSWLCTGGSDEQLNFSPSQSLTFPAWVIIPGAISNAQPTFDPTQHLDLGFHSLYGSDVAVISGLSETLSGPHAANCYDGEDVQDGIWMFGTPTFTFVDTSNETMTCNAPS
jgi:hypothetical protein